MSSGKEPTVEKRSKNFVRRIAVIASRGISETKRIQAALDAIYPIVGVQPTIVLAGNSPGLEEEILRRFDCVCLKPYSWYDKSVEFRNTQFFVANRQKIDNADLVLIFRAGEDETQWAEQYCKKRSRQYQVLAV